MIEHIEKMAEIEKSLQGLGVKTNEIEEITSQLEEYTRLKEGLENARGKQFEEDAYDILSPVQSASNKAVRALTIALRKFAEHVAYHTLHSEHGDDIQKIVDNIPLMSDEVE